MVLKADGATSSEGRGSVRAVLLMFVQLVTKTKKMFVGGLSASTTVDDVRSYFEQFGKVSRRFRALS